MSRRRTFTPEFKAKVVLEVLSGARNKAEVCRQYGLSASLISTWKAVFLEGAALVFDSDEHRSEEKARIAELERLVGQQTLESELLKKASSILNAPKARRGRPS